MLRLVRSSSGDLRPREEELEYYIDIQRNHDS
jgi:hypothetical protein